MEYILTPEMEKEIDRDFDIENRLNDYFDEAQRLNPNYYLHRHLLRRIMLLEYEVKELKTIKKDA